MAWKQPNCRLQNSINVDFLTNLDKCGLFSKSVDLLLAIDTHGSSNESSLDCAL